MDDDQHPHGPTPRSGDDLDQLFVPRLGLSLATLVAIFVGGAVGTVARYELDARHPIATGPLPMGDVADQLVGLVRHRPARAAH